LGNWVHYKTLVYWIVQGWKNYYHLLGNWVHSKTFIWIIVWTCKNYLHLLINWVHSKPSFEWLFRLARITCIYWSI
jgi:hypothetical protein